jgi:hypothetical protein
MMNEIRVSTQRKIFHAEGSSFGPKAHAARLGISLTICSGIFSNPDNSDAAVDNSDECTDNSDEEADNSDEGVDNSDE